MVTPTQKILLDKAEVYKDVRFNEVEMRVRSDVQNGRVPRTWYGILKEMEWDSSKFYDAVLLAMENENERVFKDLRGCSECPTNSADASDCCESEGELS